MNRGATHLVICLEERLGDQTPDMGAPSGVEHPTAIAPSDHQSCEAQLGEVLARGGSRDSSEGSQGGDVKLAV